LSHLNFSVTTTNAVANISFWPRHEERTYQLLARPELGLAPWEEISTNPVITPEGMGVFALTTTNSAQSFYRLRVNLNPDSGLNLLALPMKSLVTKPFEDQFCGPYRVFVR